MLSFSKACDDLSHMVNADTLRYNLVTKVSHFSSDVSGELLSNSIPVVNLHLTSRSFPQSKSKATSSSRPNTPTFLNKIADPKEILKLSTRMEEVSDAFKARTEGLIYILGRHPNLVSFMNRPRPIDQGFYDSIKPILKIRSTYQSLTFSIYFLARNYQVVRDLGVRLNFNAIYSRDKKDNENDQNVEVK